jgi:hypothetical protein
LTCNMDRSFKQYGCQFNKQSANSIFLIPFQPIFFSQRRALVEEYILCNKNELRIFLISPAL